MLHSTYHGATKFDPDDKLEVFSSGAVDKYLDLYLRASFHGLSISMRNRNAKFAFAVDPACMDKQTAVPFLGALQRRHIQDMRGDAKGRLQSWLRAELRPAKPVSLGALCRACAFLSRS